MSQYSIWFAESLWIGCSDSRVPANELIGAKYGEVFVHRNISNIVIPTDINCQAVIQYAIKHLKVRHIIITGHYNCGGISLALSSEDVDLINPWVRNIRDLYYENKELIDSLESKIEKHNKLVELNVIESCCAVMKNMNFLNQFLKHGYPIVRGCVYDVRVGVLKELDIEFEKKIAKYKGIYYLKDKNN